MPIKYNDYHEKDDFIGNTPISEQISHVNVEQSTMEDMLSNIISEKQKVDNSSIIKMVGALTPVTYYHNIAAKSAGGNLASNAQGPSDISIDNKRFQKIKNFLLKLDSGVQLESPEEETDKTYDASGSCLILPRTIQPAEGDYFIMEYYNKTYCWFINSVEVTTFESETGFKCQFDLYKRDYKIPEEQVVETYIYHHEFVGTTYRPILTPEEYEILQFGGKVYNHLSEVYNDLFYDKKINGYIFKDYDFEKSKKHYKDINNINTLGRRGGLFRASYDGDTSVLLGNPRRIREEFMVYDNFLNEFMFKNRLFRKYDGILLFVEPMLTIDRVSYKRSIYNCLEACTVAYFKNTSVSPVMIEMLQQGLCSYLVGKQNVIYSDPNIDHEDILDDMNPFKEFFPKTLTEAIINGKKADMSVKCSGMVYASIESFIIETITRYIYGKLDDFVDRIKYLHENIDNLYEHNIAYNDIFYLFPLLGYVIEQSLQKMYSDNKYD